MSYSDYDPIPGYGDYYEDDNGEMQHHEHLLLEQQSTQDYDRQQLMACLQRVIDNDSHAYLRLKAEDFKRDIELTLQHNTTATFTGV